MNNLKPLYLLAGGRRGSRSTPNPFIQMALKESEVSAPVVAFVGVASGDNESFFPFIVNLLQEAGAGKVNHALIYPDKADLAKARYILDSADGVFLSGGDVYEGMRVLKEKNMIEPLRKIYEQGKLFIGASAGSIMLSKKWVRWHDPENDSTAELFNCLSLAPIICDAHGEEDNWEELKVALDLAKDEKKGYGIASGTALRVHPDGKVEALGGAVHQFARRGSIVVRVSDLLP